MSEDGEWFSGSGQLLSAFYHPTKKHSATTVGNGWTETSVADAGVWAVSLQTKGLQGN